MAGSAIGPVGSAAQTTAGAQQPPPPAGALPPGEYSRIQIAPIRGSRTHYSAETLRKAHLALQARAKVRSGRRRAARPDDAAGHAKLLIHHGASVAEIRRQPNQKPAAELHEGVTDVYYVVGGSGTVYVGGEIENRRVSRPGEYLGQMAAGKPFKLQAGDILTVPPNMTHGTVARPGRDDLRAPEDQCRPVSLVAHDGYP